LHILLTNDDSHDSPLFLIVIELLKHYGDLTIVVPAEEQSWQGKSMTRYGPLYVDRIDLHGTPAFSVTGTPADCVNLGIYNLLESKPDIVVSGVNLGFNTGLGFLLASGTVGACFEANIAGLPGLALSQEISFEDHREWDTNRCFSDAAVAEMRDILERALPPIWEELVVRQGQHQTTWSVNLPRHLQQAEVVHTRLGRTYYEQAFQQKGDQYHHKLARFEIDQDPDTDFVVVRQGRISAAHIDLSVLGQDIRG